MNTCVVYGCCNNNVATADPTVQYYYFPKQPEIAQEWIRACSWQGSTIDLNSARICSIHFTSDCFTTEYKVLNHLSCYSKVLKYDAVPTLYLPVQLTLLSAADREVENIKDPTLTCMDNFTSDGASADIKFHAQEQLKQENVALQKRVDCLKSEIDALRNELNKTRCKYREVDSDCNAMQKKYYSLQVSAMTLQQQKSLLSKVFSESQIKILSGKKKIYWSNDDMAMGYTIRHLSNKRCYAYLSKNLNIPLPALSSIKRWATIKKHEYKVEEEKS